MEEGGSKVGGTLERAQSKNQPASRVIKKGEDRKQVCCGLAATAYAS